jgi:DMSO/TMAO reductase YedYZ molybdopterin-dependent catalytic subunit
VRNGSGRSGDGSVVSSSAARSSALARLAGLLVVLVALGVGELVAAFATPAASPVIAIGQAAIDASPQPVKSWAIRVFGSADKDVFVAGIVVVLVALALALGPVALRRPRAGMAVVAAAAALGVLAALTRPDASAGWAVPSVAAGVAGALALSTLAGTVAHRPVSAPTEPAAEAGRAVAFDRRRFLRAAMAVGAIGAGTAAIGVTRARNRSAVDSARSAIRLPRAADTPPPLPSGAELHVSDLSPFYTPNDRFYRVDTALFVPEVDVRTWTLAIRGAVEREATYTFDALIRRPLIERDITLNCVSNQVGGPYIGNARWTGVALAPLLREAGVREDADQLVSRSVDGFTAGSPMRLVLDGRDAMLAVAMNGEPLPMEHGFPVRMLVPGLYGYESATKWLSELEATTYAAYDAYWVQRGWARLAPIQTQSRIDTPRNGSARPAGTVVVAGVAWAQHTGVERVEVRVDDGRWNDAMLAAQDTVDTWRQWRWDWPATPGPHTLTVRATDADGVVQPSTRTQPFPSGATGWHSVTVSVA